jgi:hypothetical protein
MQWDQKQKFHETHEHLGLAITEVLLEKNHDNIGFCLHFKKYLQGKNREEKYTEQMLQRTLWF